MNEAFEKIINNIKELADYNGCAYIDSADIIEIVQEVAEEYDKEEEIKNGRVIFCDMHNQCDYINHWIPCSERLPSGLDFVLYTCKDGEVDICSIEYFYDYLNKFTAWQPLPSPFREIEVNSNDD